MASSLDSWWARTRSQVLEASSVAHADGVSGAPGAVDPVGLLYRELFAPLCRRLAARLRVSCAAEAVEDGVQTAFMILADKYSREGFLPDHPGLWLARVAWIQALRAAGVQRRRPGRLDDGTGSSGTGLEDSRARGTISVLVEEEQFEVTREAIEQLSADERKIVETHILQGRTFAEIAAETGRSEAAVRKACQRALRRIQDSLGRYSSSLVQEGDSRTYLPRTREGLIAAFRSLPVPYSERLEEQYVHELEPRLVAQCHDLRLETVVEQRSRAEALFLRKYSVPVSSLAPLLRSV